MTSVGEDLVAYLAAQGIGTPGSDLWLGQIPDVQTAIALVETGGPAPYHEYGDNAIDNPSIQVLVRNPNYLTGGAKAKTIKEALDGLANWPINGTRYLSISAMGDPAYLGKISTAEGETHEFSINFATMRERAAPVIGICGAYYDLSEWWTP